MTPMILAHQGGWDEALFVLAPLVVIGALLLLANRRADARNRPTTRPPTATPTIGRPDDQSNRSMSAPSARSLPTRSS